ncbi:MAG: DUF342 domain-containing protein [Desulfobacteraceae bacterium]|nr:DUF342 domain-containing protein [Desulfobacteraceae bacterium]
MADTNSIPTLAGLALRYGTIDNTQYRHLIALHALKKKEKHPIDHGNLLLDQKFATRYQIGLLKLIQEYHIVKKRGEEFGEIAIAKGFATPTDVQKAIRTQKTEFKRAKIKKLIGDILVESRVITTKQKNTILKEQTLLEQSAGKLYSGTPEDKQQLQDTARSIGASTLPDSLELSDYEKKFLQIKVLDREFTARVREKELASERAIIIAQKIQEKEFEKKDTLRILGDIMVSMEFITEEQKKIILKEQNRSDTPQEEDHAVMVTISPDKLTARVKINKKFLSQITVSQLKTVLKAHGITNGIYPDALLQSQLNLENLEFPAARSDFSSKLMKAKNLEFYLETDLTTQGEKKKGDPLAKQNLNHNILIATDVFGNEIKQECSKKVAIRCGSGTRPSHDGTKILAAKTGIPSLSIEGKLFIHPIINVLEDADLRYGPLEAYANLSISGVLTGAYPITAGSIRAREIRGARIESIGDIRTDVGITDAVIRSQGDIHARYLHNCQIETFGNIYIENEIFDSKIICSGKIDSPGCRIISSSIFAKKGVKIAGAGSEKTKPCSITSGGEHHILELEKSIYQEIDRISTKLKILKTKKATQEKLSQKIFQKMIELKTFHDRAKKTKRVLAIEFKNNRDQFKKAKLKNIVTLISNFETRMTKSIVSLKKINKTKKSHDQKKIKIENKIISLTPKTNAATMILEEKLFLFFEWTRYQENISKIEITGKAFPGTKFYGIYSSITIDSSLENFSILEICNSKENFKMEVLKNN